ncbi:hypothetical protein E3N88_03191 [Mikania micrantha]|uniref:Uncharacterized protein n=1 Tax=Mikania micrantha TaxID=192012 RepID=A0A5N6Q5V2_9ASTR|nr:hypothetical protein E3N88_03191 [Mikania micrantha]
MESQNKRVEDKGPKKTKFARLPPRRGIGPSTPFHKSSAPSFMKRSARALMLMIRRELAAAERDGGTSAGAGWGWTVVKRPVEVRRGWD